MTTVEIVPTGGQSGAYLHSSGNISGATNDTPSHTGDLSQAQQVEISFDLKYFTTALSIAYLRLRYKSFAYNGWKLPFTDSFEEEGWIHYTITIDPMWSDDQAQAQGWIRESNSATFQETMADIYKVEIRITGSNAEIGIDNYSMWLYHN